MGTRRGNSQVDLSQPLVTPPADVECKANFLWIVPLPPSSFSLSFLGFLPSRLLREFNILLCRLVHKAHRETILVRRLRRQGNMVIHLENVRWVCFVPFCRDSVGSWEIRSFGENWFFERWFGIGCFFFFFFVFFFPPFLFPVPHDISLDP